MGAYGDDDSYPYLTRLSRLLGGARAGTVGFTGTGTGIGVGFGVGVRRVGGLRDGAAGVDLRCFFLGSLKITFIDLMYWLLTFLILTRGFLLPPTTDVLRLLRFGLGGIFGGFGFL